VSDVENDVVRKAVRKVELAEARARRLGYSFLALVATVNLTAAGISVWNTYEIKALTKAQSNFARAHASASYQRAETTIRVVECADDYFFAYLGGQKPPRSVLDDCFRMPLQTPILVPLEKEPTK
jgi:hypothetical protein